MFRGVVNVSALVYIFAVQAEMEIQTTGCKRCSLLDDNSTATAVRPVTNSAQAIYTTYTRQLTITTTTHNEYKLSTSPRNTKPNNMYMMYTK